MSSQTKTGVIANGMTARQRVLAALEHRQPDRVPRDLGGCLAAGINITAAENLHSHFGITERIDIQLERASLARPSETILQRFRIDTRSVWAGADCWTVGRPNDDGTHTDDWGVVRAAPRGGGIHAVVRSPLAGEITAETIRDLAEHWPDPSRPELVEGVGKEAQRLRDTTDCAIVLNLPLGVFHYAQFLRGYDTWLMDLALDPALVCYLHDTLLEITIEQARRLLQAVGNNVDVVCYGDDIAMDTGPLVSPAMYRRLLRPYLQKVFASLREISDAKILYHCDGDITWLVDDLVDMGVDAINPVQVSSGPMSDTAALKSQFGDRITFWGGIDTERVLPFGTAQDVETEVQRRTQDLAPGGGYVMATVHNIQAEVPPENIVTLWRAADTMAEIDGQTR